MVAITMRNELPPVLSEEKPCDYLCPSRSSTPGAVVTSSDRTSIVDWLYRIAEQCRLDLAQVAAAMGLVDRFLSHPSRSAQDALHDGQKFRLLAIAALSLCVQTDKMTAPGASDFLALVSVPEIEEAASRLRRGLGAGLRAPTSLQLARHFLSLPLPGVDLEESRWSCVLDDVRFQLEYAVRDYYFALQWPRTVAMAAILNALDEVVGQDRRVMCHLWTLVASEHFPSQTDVRDVLAAKSRLRSVMERDERTEDDTVMSEE